jgi:hypothetical protein
MNRKIIFVLLSVTLISAIYVGCKKDSKTGTCTDGVKNQDETGVDCGGVCSPCPSCADGIQNQGEEDIDCGGPCTACATPAFSALIDGTPWSAVDTFYVDSTMISGTTTYRIYGRTGSKNIDFFMSFTDGQNALAVGTEYTDAPTTGFTLIWAKYVENSTIYNYNAGTVKIKFTRFGNGRAVGSFSFVGRANNVNKSVTTGVMTRVKIY